MAAVVRRCDYNWRRNLFWQLRTIYDFLFPTFVMEIIVADHFASAMHHTNCTKHIHTQCTKKGYLTDLYSTEIRRHNNIWNWRCCLMFRVVTSFHPITPWSIHQLNHSLITVAGRSNNPWIPRIQSISLHWLSAQKDDSLPKICVLINSEIYENVTPGKLFLRLWVQQRNEINDKCRCLKLNTQIFIGFYDCWGCFISLLSIIED